MIETTLVNERPPAVAAPSALRIALAGCGVVGSELARLLQMQGEAIELDHGVRPKIVRVLVRDPGKERPVDLPPALLTPDASEFLGTSADVVVEAIGGTELPERIAREALGRGARFVTANKALIAAMGDDLVALARSTGGRVDFEAAVGGGMPVIRVLREALSEGPIHRIRAILNGTTNYILTLLEDGTPFDRALLDAQRNGFAEADPTRDLDGTDATDKIRILAWLAYGVPPRSVFVRRQGILPDPDRLARDAAAIGGSVRLLAECASTGGKVTASVEPVIVPHESEFGRTRGEQNHVSVDFGWSGPVSLSAPGAGGVPTASALLGDVLRSCGPLPCRDRLARATPEVQPRSWLVSVDRGARDLRRHLDAADLETETLPAAGADDRMLVTNCGWSRLEAALENVRAAGGRPLVTRTEMPERTTPDRLPGRVVLEKIF